MHNCIKCEDINCLHKCIQRKIIQVTVKLNFQMELIKEFKEEN